MAYRPRLWHVVVFLVLFSVLGVVLAGVLRHRQGLKQVRELCEARQARGQIGSLDDLLAHLPMSDDALQARWLAWSNAHASTWVDPNYDDEQLAAWVTGSGPFPQTIADTVAARAANMQEARDLLGDPALLLSGAGWIRTHLPEKDFTMVQVASLPLANLLVHRDLAEWLRHAALLADDPRPYLQDLNALIHASRCPLTIIDAMIQAATINFRDRTFIECALRHTLPDDLRESWTTAPVASLAQTAHGLMYEGLLSGLGIANWLKQTPFGDDFRKTSRIPSLKIALELWWDGTHDAARLMDYEFAAHDRLAGLTTGPLPTSSILSNSGGYLLRIITPNVLEAAMTTLEAEAHQRACRLAVLLITAPTGSELPVDSASFLGDPHTAILLQPSGDAYHLAYERLSPTRFRIGIAPTTPVPDFADATRIPSLSKAWGTPASTSPLTLSRNGPIEVELPRRDKE